MDATQRDASQQAASQGRRAAADFTSHASAASSPAAQGLYDPANEHDACGVGFIAHVKGRKSHRIIEQGLQILCNLDHRGAVGADPHRCANRRIVAFEQRVVVQRLIDLLRQLKRRQLQQPDRLLQLRRQRQMLS